MDTTVIVMRLQKLENYVRHLRQLQIVPLDEYVDDENLQAIVERRLQLAIQVCMDIANYLIAQLNLQSPEEPQNVFITLRREDILPKALADRLVSSVRFRNILVHDYLEIDSAIVHAHLSAEINDFEQFAREITSKFLR